MEFKKIEKANNVDELLELVSFEDIKKAVLFYYQPDILSYKKYFHEPLKWLFLSKNEAIKKIEKHIYGIISLYKYEQYYLVLYNKIDLSEVDQSFKKEAKNIIQNEFNNSDILDESFYYAIIYNRLITPAQSYSKILSEDKKTIINFIKECSLL